MYTWVGMINLFLRSLKGRCYSYQIFGTNLQKLAYPTSILCAGIPQRMGRSQHDARVNTANDPSMSDKNLVNFGPVTPEFCSCVFAGRATCWALPRIFSIEVWCVGMVIFLFRMSGHCWFNVTKTWLQCSSQISRLIFAVSHAKLKWVT